MVNCLFFFFFLCIYLLCQSLIMLYLSCFVKHTHAHAHTHACTHACMLAHLLARSHTRMHAHMPRSCLFSPNMHPHTLFPPFSCRTHLHILTLAEICIYIDTYVCIKFLKQCMSHFQKCAREWKVCVSDGCEWFNKHLYTHTCTQTGRQTCIHTLVLRLKE